MSARTKRTERRQRFRRAWHGQNRARAVSPVVATLILILIAVAAAAALYLWLVVWQGNITGGIGSPHAEATVTIGGSTSVYPFTSLAVTWFEQNYSDISISDNQGGTGAGMLAVCAESIDVGAASTPETPATLESSYGCLSSDTGITITPIAYDAVDVVVQGANPHGLLSINWDTLTYIYDRASTTTPTLLATSLDGTAISSITGYPTTGALEWENIPAAVLGATVGGVTEKFDTGTYSTTNVGTQTGACGASFPADICDTSGAAGTPCGFTVCAGGATAAVQTAAIVPVERSDAAGATLTLEAKLFGATSASGFATTYAGLGYNGCGTANSLSNCGINVATQENGDPALLGEVAGNPNAIGYASDGLARTTAGIGTAGIVPFAAVGQVVLGVPQSGAGFPVTTGTTTAYNGIVPTTGSTGTIASGITDSSTANQYAGWRPFELVTLQPPSGVVQEYITFITDPANNAALAAATDEVGLYQV